VLEGSFWQLVSGVEVEGWESVAPTARFENGRMAGSTGCNQYTAPYTVDGDTLELGPVVSTRMACAPPADAVERGYLAALERVTRWLGDADEVVLLADDGADLLRFRPSAEPPPADPAVARTATAGV
jgi:heat shock protein HslJ